MSGLLLLAALLSTSAGAEPSGAAYEVGVAAGAGAVAGELALLATPWAGARWGRLGVALQAPLRFIPDQSGLREADWDERADYGRLLRFVAWGDARDPFELRAGVVARRTLGQGTLVRRYHNGTDDDHFRVGLDARATGSRWTLQAFADHLLGPPVLAARAAVDLLPALALGVTFAADTAAPRGSSGRLDDGALVADRFFLPAYGVDLSLALPVVDGLVFTPYADLNRLDDRDFGLHVGAVVDLGLSAWRVALRGEWLRAGSGYDWAAFDTQYLVRRWGERGPAPGADGGRGGVEVTYLDAATVGFEYAAAGERHADLSAWVEVPTASTAFTAFYARRGERGDLLDPAGSLAAVALRLHIDGAWWINGTLARVWRVHRLDADHGALRPFTEAAVTLEAALGP